MSTKYRIDSAKRNKNLINDEIQLSRIKADGGRGGHRKPRDTKAPTWFQIFVDKEFKPLKQEVTSLRKDVNTLRKDVNTLKQDFEHVVEVNELTR
ncbi:MAG: hypothetical protein MJ223_02710 [Mycoplasmoidaceae bacterium]|nr:hypothetical protein [Mycoplasmoidaceae bacterium]